MNGYRPPLTDRQERILKFVRLFIDDFGYPPSNREIVEGCAISSTSVVAYNLYKLQLKGYMEIGRGLSRAIRLVRWPGEVCLACGRPFGDGDRVRAPEGDDEAGNAAVALSSSR